MTQPLPVAFTRRASRQVEKAGGWWRENRPKAPDALGEELEQALQMIASHPEVGATARNVKLGGVRRILLNRVSYHLYYRPRETPVRSIQVLALWHASRSSRPPL